MANIEIYSSGHCVFCIMAERFFKGKDLPYTVYRVDADQQTREEMEVRSNGHRTVPQIFINDHHIGGYTDLAQLDRDGKLEPLLANTE